MQLWDNINEKLVTSHLQIFLTSRLVVDYICKQSKVNALRQILLIHHLHPVATSKTNHRERFAVVG